MKVGINITKLAFDVSWFAQGKSSHKCFDYTEQSMALLLGLLPDDAHVVMEATGSITVDWQCGAMSLGYL